MKFKIGDKVKFAGHTSIHSEGEIATVVAVDDRFWVKFDDCTKNCTDVYGFINEACEGWNHTTVNIEDLFTLVSPARKKVKFVNMGSYFKTEEIV